MDLYERIIELSSMGYHCSQMIMILTLWEVLAAASVTVEIPVAA